MTYEIYDAVGVAEEATSDNPMWLVVHYKNKQQRILGLYSGKHSIDKVERLVKRRLKL